MSKKILRKKVVFTRGGIFLLRLLYPLYQHTSASNYRELLFLPIHILILIVLLIYVIIMESLAKIVKSLNVKEVLLPNMQILFDR